MSIPTKSETLEHFEQFIQQPENHAKNWELIHGEIVEKMVSGNLSAIIAMRLMRYLTAFVDDNQLGTTSGPDGGYQIGEERYIPDGAYISYERHPKPTDDAYVPYPPHLAVEVISKTDRTRDVTLKIANYLSAGVVVWVAYPEAQEMHVFVPGQPAQVFTRDDTLTGGEVLPGFELPLTQLFRD